MNEKQELQCAINEYLNQVEKLRLSEAFDLFDKGEYVWVFGISAFYEQDDDEAFYFLAPAVAEQKLMNEVSSLFDSKVRVSTVRSTLHSEMRPRVPKTEFTFPFATDHEAQRYLDRVYEALIFHYEYRCDALVPLYQLECDNGVEFPLARTVLYSGGKQSMLAESLKENAASLFEDDKKRIENCSFLRLPVTGDSPSRLEQVEYEAERALQVLRFVYPWFENDGKAYNPAHGVSTLKQSKRVVIYHRTSDTGEWSHWHTAIPNGIYGTQRISAELLSAARRYDYLDSINHHFQNHDHNAVSRRFCRAFMYYDIASRTLDADVALANFVICVDILLPSGKAEELTQFLILLIKNGDLYVGPMTLNEQLKDPETTEWPEKVRLTVRDYRQFCILRHKVLHGNTMIHVIDYKQVQKSRQIAANAIRAYAKLSRAFQWQDDKEAKSWFKSPCKPPQ